MNFGHYFCLVRSSNLKNSLRKVIFIHKNGKISKCADLCTFTGPIKNLEPVTFTIMFENWTWFKFQTVHSRNILIVRKPHERLRDFRNISVYDGWNVPKITQPYTRLIILVHIFYCETFLFSVYFEGYEASENFRSRLILKVYLLINSSVHEKIPITLWPFPERNWSEYHRTQKWNQEETMDMEKRREPVLFWSTFYALFSCPSRQNDCVYRVSW